MPSTLLTFLRGVTEVPPRYRLLLRTCFYIKCLSVPCYWNDIVMTFMRFVGDILGDEDYLGPFGAPCALVAELATLDNDVQKRRRDDDDDDGSSEGGL